MGRVRSVGKTIQGRGRPGRKTAAGVNLHNVLTCSQQAKTFIGDAPKKKVSNVNKTTALNKKISSVKNSGKQNHRIARTSSDGTKICTGAALKIKCLNKGEEKVKRRGRPRKKPVNCSDCEGLVPATSPGLQPRVILHDVGTSTDTLESHVAGNSQSLKPMPFRKKVKCLWKIRSRMTNGNCTAGEVADIQCMDEAILSGMSPEKARPGRRKLVRRREVVSEGKVLSPPVSLESSQNLKVEDTPVLVLCGTKQRGSEELPQDKKIKLDCDLQKASACDGLARFEESCDEDSTGIEGFVGFMFNNVDIIGDGIEISLVRDWEIESLSSDIISCAYATNGKNKEYFPVSEDAIADVDDKANVSALLPEVLPQTLYKACPGVCKGREEKVANTIGPSTVVSVQKCASSNTEDEESVDHNVDNSEQYPAVKDDSSDVDIRVAKQDEILLVHNCKKPRRLSRKGPQNTNYPSSEHSVGLPRRSSRSARRISTSSCDNSPLHGSQISLQVSALEEASPSKSSKAKKLGRPTRRKNSESQEQSFSLIKCSDSVNVTLPAAIPEILKGSLSSEVTRDIASSRVTRSTKKVPGTTVSQADSQQCNVLDVNMDTYLTSEEMVEQANAHHKSPKVNSVMKKHDKRKSIILENNEVVCIKNEGTLKIAVANDKANNSVVDSAENSHEKVHSHSVSCQQKSFPDNVMHETRKRKLVFASGEMTLELEMANDSSNQNSKQTFSERFGSEERVVVEAKRCRNENVGHLGVPLSGPKSKTLVSVTTGSIVSSVDLSSSPVQENNSLQEHLHTDLLCGENKVHARSLGIKNRCKGNTVSAKHKDSHSQNVMANQIKMSSFKGNELFKPDLSKKVRSPKKYLSVKESVSSLHDSVSCVASNAERAVDAVNYLKNPLSAEKDSDMQSRGRSGVNSLSTSHVHNSNISRVLHNNSKKKSALMPTVKHTTSESECSSVSNGPNKNKLDFVSLSQNGKKTSIIKPCNSLKQKRVVAVERNVTGNKVTPHNKQSYSLKESKFATYKNNVTGKRVYTGEMQEEPANLSGDVAVACDSCTSISSPGHGNDSQMCSERIDFASVLGLSPKNRCEFDNKFLVSGSANNSPKVTKLLRTRSVFEPGNTRHSTSDAVASNIFPDSGREGSLEDVANKLCSDLVPTESTNITESNNNLNGAEKSKGLSVQVCSSPSISLRNLQETLPSTNLSSLEIFQRTSVSSFAFKKPATTLPVQLRQSLSATSKPEIRKSSLALQRSNTDVDAWSSVRKTAQQAPPKLPRACGVANPAHWTPAANGVSCMQNHVDTRIDDDDDDAISLFACSDIFGTEFGGQECKVTRVGVTKPPAFLKDSDDESDEENDIESETKQFEFHQEGESASLKNLLAPAATVSANTVVPESTLASKDNIPSSDQHCDRSVTPLATPSNCNDDNTTSFAKSVIFPVKPNITLQCDPVVADTELDQEAKPLPITDGIKGPMGSSRVGKMGPKSQTTQLAENPLQAKQGPAKISVQGKFAAVSKPKELFAGIPVREKVGLKNLQNARVSQEKLDVEDKTKGPFTVQGKMGVKNLSSEGPYTEISVQGKLSTENKTKGLFVRIPGQRNVGHSNPSEGLPIRTPVPSKTEGSFIGISDQRMVGIKSPSEGSYSGIAAQSRLCAKSQMRQFPVQGNVGPIGTSEGLYTNISVSPKTQPAVPFAAMQGKVDPKSLSEGSHVGIPQQVNQGPKMHNPGFADCNVFKREYCKHFMRTGNCTRHHCSDLHSVPEFSASQKKDLKELLMKSLQMSFHFAFEELLSQFLMTKEKESKKQEEHNQFSSMYQACEWALGVLQECGMTSDSALNKIVQVLSKKKDYVISNILKRSIIELAACKEVVFETWPAVKMITNDYSGFVCSVWVLEKHICACISSNCVDVAFCKTVLKLLKQVQGGCYIDQVKPDLLQKFCSVVESVGLSDEIVNVTGDSKVSKPICKTPEKPACKSANFTTPLQRTAYPRILCPENSKEIPKYKPDFQPTHISTVASPSTISPPMMNLRGGVIDLRNVVEAKKRQRMQASVTTKSNASDIQHFSSDSLGGGSTSECTKNAEGLSTVNIRANNVDAGKVVLPKQCSAVEATHPSQPVSGSKLFKPRLVRRNWSCGNNSVDNVGETSCSPEVSRRLSLQNQTSVPPLQLPSLLPTPPIPPHPELRPSEFGEPLHCPAALTVPMNRPPGMSLHGVMVEQKLRNDLEVVRRCLINGDHATVARIIEERRSTPQSSAIAREAFEVLKDEVAKMTHHYQNIVKAAGKPMHFGGRYGFQT